MDLLLSGVRIYSLYRIFHSFPVYVGFRARLRIATAVPLFARAH